MTEEKRGSAGRFMGWHTIFEKGDKPGPYMTRIWIGRLRLHIFHRGDLDPDCHDHPWDFWTFPLTSYVEEVVVDEGPVFGGFTETGLRRSDVPNGQRSVDRYLQVVPVWRLTFRPATHCHRVLGAHDPAEDTLRDGRHQFDEFVVSPGIHPTRKIVTIVWRSETKRSWGFLKSRDGRWCWIAWRDYVFNGGKTAPCDEESR